MGEKFEEVWSEASARLTRTLRRRGVDAALVEDVVQEAGARSLERQVAFTDVEDLLRWLNTVASRLVIDSFRKTRHLDAVAEVPELPDVIDVGRVVEGRMRLSAVRRCLPLLSLADQASLLQSPEDWPAQDGREAHRIAMRRLRARARLAAMIDGALALLAWLRLRWRLRAPKVEAVAVTLPVVLLVAVGLLPHAPTELPPRSSMSEARATLPTPDLNNGPTNRFAAVSSQPTSTYAPTARPTLTPTGAPSEIVEVALPGINGEGRVWARPQEEGDPIACVDTIINGVACVEQVKLR